MFYNMWKFIYSIFLFYFIEIIYNVTLDILKLTNNIYLILNILKYEKFNLNQ